MNYHVVEARHVGGHTMWLRFRDGTAGEIDLAPALRGPIMEPLKDVNVFVPDGKRRRGGMPGAGACASATEGEAGN
jgi:hypothetical protein